jgi:catechol 2,3-dioxygenase-like lactoylglutathione lyase family enzyme
MWNPGINSQITFLRTTDIKRIHQFYQGTLKLPMVLDQGTCRIYEVSKRGFIGFCYQEEKTNNSSEIIFTMVTSKVDEWFNFLIDNKVELQSEPKLNSQFNIYHFFFKDPDGNIIEIQEFLDPRWAKKSNI